MRNSGEDWTTLVQLLDLNAGWTLLSRSNRWQIHLQLVIVHGPKKQKKKTGSISCNSSLKRS